VKITATGRRLKSGAPYLNLTERANLVLRQRERDLDGIRHEIGSRYAADDAAGRGVVLALVGAAVLVEVLGPRLKRHDAFLRAAFLHPAADVANQPAGRTPQPREIGLAVGETGNGWRGMVNRPRQLCRQRRRHQHCRHDQKAESCAHGDPPPVS
jgi:hypothetical protein